MLKGLFDTHAHPNDERFDADREQLLSGMRNAGISYCMCVGADMKSSRECIALAEKYDGLYAAVGVHPHDAKEVQTEDLNLLTEWLSVHEKVKALGEIGLDYFYDYSPREVQKDVFEKQLDLGWRLKKPVILHIRDAHSDALRILKNRKKELPDCVLHCCSASWELVKEYLDLGCMISFAGPVTFKKSASLHNVAKRVPIDRMMIETDSPYLAPEPVRGRRNEPGNVAYICQHIAELREMPAQDLCDATRKNGLRFYRICET